MAETNKLKQNFLHVARSNVFALVFPILALPFLSRLFAPADFGVAAVFSSVVAFTLSFATWRFDWLLPNEKSIFIATNLCVAGGIILIGFALVLILVLFVARESFVIFRPFVGRENILWLLPFALLVGGVRQLLNGWRVRMGDLRLVGSATLAQSTSNVVFSISAGHAGLGGLGLVISSIASTWTGFLILAANAMQSLRRSMRRVSVKTVILAADRYRASACWSTLVSVLNASSLNVPVLALAWFYAPQQVGWYALVNRMVASPVGTLSSALGQSFWAHAANFARNGNYAGLRASYVKMTMRLALASGAIAAACFGAPLLLGSLLGAEEWTGAGYVMMAMTPFFVGSLVFSPTNHLVVLDLQHFQLLADALRLSLVLIGIVLADYFDFGFTAAVFLASLGSFCGHAVLFLIHWRAHARYERF